MSSTTVIVSVATALAGAVAAVLGTSENEPRSVGGPEGGVELAPAQPADSVLLDVGSARRPEPETSNPTADSARASWAARFRESSDNAEFVARTLGAALAGDGEAKFYLYLALNECASAQVLFAGGSRPEDLPASDALSGEEAEALFRRCAGLAAADPFIGLPAREGGYPPQYWLDEAANGGHLMARLVRAQTQILAAASASGSEAGRAASEIRGLVGEAIRVRDPEAMLRAGTLLNQIDGEKSVRSAALMLLACRQGARCTEGARDSAVGTCRKPSADCVPGADFPWYLQRALGATRFAQAAALAEEMASLHEAADPEALTRTVLADLPTKAQGR